MALSEKERMEKLSKAKTGTDFYDLYKKNFGEEFPIVDTLDGNEKIEMIIDAIETNVKVKGLNLSDNTNM